MKDELSHPRIPRAEGRQKVHGEITDNTVAIIGLGYVGLPLAVAFGRGGVPVIGVELSQHKVDELMAGRSYIPDVPSADIAMLVERGLLRATTDYDAVREADSIFICVPTPYDAAKAPDLSFIVSAAEGIRPRLRRGHMVVLQSTTYPGTTDEIVLPILERSGLKAGLDFDLAFSPERIDPGNTRFNATNTPKVVGGITARATQRAADLLRRIGAPVEPVSSARAAEMTKLLENIFRSVNIALVNELALLCERMGLDVWEVIRAATTKPFGFMPFYPGPGVGGHCLKANEYIFIRNGNGMQAVQVGPYAMHLAQNSSMPRVLDQGGVTVWRPPHIEILSFDPHQQKPCFCPLEFISRRPYDGRMVNVLTVDGRQLTTTDGHPMIVWDGEQACVRRADQLQPNDELIVPLGQPTPDQPLPPLDLIEYLSPNDIARMRVTPVEGRFEDYREKLTPHLRKVGLAGRGIYRDNAMPLSAYLELERTLGAPFPRRAIWLSTGRGPSYGRCPAVIAWDEDFARLIGYYLSEGCITEDNALRVRFTFNADERETIADLKRILDKIGLRHSTYRDKQWNSVTLKVSSRPFAILLRDGLQCGTDSHTMRIPGLLMTAPQPLRMALLTGLLRGDGDVHHVNQEHIYRKGDQERHDHLNTCTVGYFSSSPELFQQVTILLQGLDFVPTFKRDKPQLRLYGQEQLERLAPLFLDIKHERLEAYRQGRRKRMSNIQSCRREGFATVKVRQVAPADPEEAVYSVEVARTHNFITSFGLLTHNCIPIDPLYLSWKAREYDFHTNFIDLAAEVNESMPYHVVDLVAHGLSRQGRGLAGANVLVLGVAFKRDIDDPRNSPAERVIELLLLRGAQVQYHDPYVPRFRVGPDVFHRQGLELTSIPLEDAALREADGVVIVTGHRVLDYARVVDKARLVVDCCNATAQVEAGREKITLLGAAGW